MFSAPEDAFPTVAPEIVSQAQQLISSTHLSESLPLASGDSAKREEFFIFYSFDLVNSTQFKTRYPQKWPRLTSEFFETVERLMQDNFIKLPKGVTAKRWKYAGDEVLFYQKVTKAGDCDHALPIARKVLDDAIVQIQTNESAAELLSIKGAVWCARTVRYKAAAEETQGHRFKELEGQCRNIVVGYDPENRGQNLDFLGPEVDAGFRVAKLATRGRLLVSADLAYLYLKRRDLKDDKGRSIMEVIRVNYPHYALRMNTPEMMRIVHFEKLKGVWEGRSYPVIWFENDWENIKQTFHYDDSIESTFLKAARENPATPLSALERIYENRGQIARMNDFVEEVNKMHDVNEETLQPKIPRAEFHCAPVCISPDFKVLIAKRRADKGFLPDHWEFGCGQLDEGQSVPDCLKQTCAEDFGLELDPDKQPIPLEVFSFSRDSNGQEEKIVVPGLTLAVMCKPGQNAQKNKHAEVEWIGVDDLHRFVDAKRVEDFDRVVRLAIGRTKEMWSAN